jgi:hypothetical protein
MMKNSCGQKTVAIIGKISLKTFSGMESEKNGTVKFYDFMASFVSRENDFMSSF